MPERSPGDGTALKGRPGGGRWLPRLTAQGSNGRLHLALLSALALAALLMLALPLSSSRAVSQPLGPVPSAPVALGLTITLRAHAEAVAGVLAEAAASPDGLAGEALPGSSLLPKPLLVMASRFAAMGALASPAGQPPLIVRLGPALPFTVHEQGLVSSYASPQPTVGQALREAGIALGPKDIVRPSPDTPLSAGLHVFIDHAKRVELTVGGQSQTVYTRATLVGGLLAEQGIILGERDRVSPPLTAPLRQGMTVVVTIVREETEVEEEPIHYTTVYRDDPSLPRGEYRLLQAGSDGYTRREYRVVYENGVEVSRELIGERRVPPTAEVIARGTGPVSSRGLPAPGGDLECVRTMRVYATWYTAASAGGSGITATGTPVTKGVVAVDPRVIPLGTRMYIPGYGFGVAADTGGGIIGNMIDLGYGPNDVYDWKTGWVEICILE